MLKYKSNFLIKNMDDLKDFFQNSGYEEDFYNENFSYHQVEKVILNLIKSGDVSCWTFLKEWDIDTLESVVQQEESLFKALAFLAKEELGYESYLENLDDSFESNQKDYTFYEEDYEEESSFKPLKENQSI